jgi:hypothetical protein
MATKESNRGIARMASMQAVAHMPMIMGGSTQTRPPKVYRVIDGNDIYHLGHCDWFLGNPPEERLYYRHHLIGTFYHPNLILAQYDVGGEAKIGMCCGSEPESTKTLLLPDFLGIGSRYARRPKPQKTASRRPGSECSRLGCSTKALRSLTRTMSK